jgi:hypothetical protein
MLLAAAAQFQLDLREGKKEAMLICCFARERRKKKESSFVRPRDELTI